MWVLRFAAQAAEQMRRLDKAAARRIKVYLDEMIDSGDPRSRGRALSGSLAGYWRYRIGDYRVVAAIEDGRLVVVALQVGHRSQVYRSAPQ